MIPKQYNNHKKQTIYITNNLNKTICNLFLHRSFFYKNINNNEQTQKKHGWKKRTVYYKRADFVNKFSFLLPMKHIWNRLYKTHLLTKVINSTMGASLSAQGRFSILNKNKADFVLFNKYWNHYTNLSEQQLPLWNFKTFNKEMLLMRCSYDQFSQETPIFSSSKNYFKTYFISIFKIARLIPVIYGMFFFIFLLLLVFSFISYKSYIFSGQLFDIYLSQAFYFIWDLYVLPTNTYTYAMFQYPEYMFRFLLLFELNWVYKGPGYWESFILDESELFLALFTKTIMYFQYITIHEFWNSWASARGISDIMYISRGTYSVYEDFIYLIFTPFLTWRFTLFDLDRIIHLAFIEISTSLITNNLISAYNLGGILNSSYSITLPYGLNTGHFTKAMWLLKLKLLKYIKLTIDPQTWFTFMFQVIENMIKIIQFDWYVETLYELNNVVSIYLAFKLIIQELLINFSYYTVKRCLILIHNFFAIQIYQNIIIELIYDQFIYVIYNFIYTYFYWYTSWYLFQFLNIVWKILWFLMRKLLLIDYFYEWWMYFSFRLDLPYLYMLLVILKECFRLFVFFSFKMFDLSGYYFHKKIGDFLLINFILYFENNYIFGHWLKLSSLSIQLFSNSFPLYIHDSFILPIIFWTQDLGSLNFYISIKAYNSALTTLFYPITLVFFDTKWAFPVDTLNMSWRPYNTDWYIPETFWFFKRFGPVFIDHSYLLSPYTLLYNSEIFFRSISFFSNLDILDKPMIDIPFWSFDYLEQEWYSLIHDEVIKINPLDLSDEELMKYANYDLFNKLNLYTPFMSFTLILREFIFTSVKLTSFLPSNVAQMYWTTLWYFAYNLMCVLDNTYNIIMYKDTWENWFLWIYHPFYFSELRLLYLIQDGLIRIEKLKLFLKLYNFNENPQILVWIENLTKSSIFLPANEDIFFKSFFYILNSTKTIGFLENIKDYLLIRDSYGGNLLIILNDVWFTQAGNLQSNEMFSSLTVIFWEAFNMWSLDDVDSIEKGDPHSMIESLDIHNPILWGQWFHYQELSEILLNHYWHNWWFRPIFNHWWVRANVQTTRQLLRIDHPLWTATYDRHLWKGFVNYNYNLPYRKGFSIARSVGFKPGFHTGDAISATLGVGRHSGYSSLGLDLLHDVGSFQQKMLMFRNLNTDPVFVIMQHLPNTFKLFLQTIEFNFDKSSALQRHEFFINFSNGSSILAKLYHFLFVDSLYSFFIFSGLPAGYIDTLQLSNPVINFLSIFKIVETYFFYFIYISLLINIFWEDFLPGHFEAYFILYFIFFSHYSLINKVFLNENIAINLFISFYNLKLFIINIFQPWSISKWEFFLLKWKYSLITFWPKTFEEERFLKILKTNDSLEWFLIYHKYIYNITFNALWFEYLLTSYFITENNFDTTISNHDYISDFHTWKYENTSVLWVKNQKTRLLSIMDDLNLEYMKPYIYDGYIKLITDFNNIINTIFVYIRTNFFFFNEDLILKDDYIKSMLFFNLILEAILNGSSLSSLNKSLLFKEYIMENLFFKELEIYFTYIYFYNSDNYLLFFNPWTNYILEGDFNIYEFVWNKRTVRWHGLPGFWYVFDICYFFIFIIFVTIWFLILHSYLRALAKKGDPWFDYIVSIYPEIIQRHKKAYLFKDTFVVDEEAADNILEYYKYYYDSFDYIYLPYRSFKTASLSRFQINKDSHFINVDPLTGNAVYLVDFTNLKKPFSNLFSYNSRFLLKKHAYEADRYVRRQRKIKKHTPSLSWYNYKDSFRNQIFKKTSWSIWLFFIVFILFFSTEYFFFFKRSWLFNYFFLHKISTYINTLFWEELFFSLNPYFFDGLFSIFLLINLFLIWYLIWVFYFFSSLWISNWYLLTSNSIKLFYAIIFTLFFSILQSLRFWKGRIGFLNYIGNSKFSKLSTNKHKSIFDLCLFVDDQTSTGIDVYENNKLSTKVSIDNIFFFKDLRNPSNNLKHLAFNQNNRLINLYLKNLSVSDLNTINYIDNLFLSKIKYTIFLNKLQNKSTNEFFNMNLYKNNKNMIYSSNNVLSDLMMQKNLLITKIAKNNFFFIDKIIFDKSKNLAKSSENHFLIKSRLQAERVLESKGTIQNYFKTTSNLIPQTRQHNDLSVSFINDFLVKSKQLSVFNKWDIAEFVQMFDDMPWIDRGAPKEILDPKVPNFLGDQKPELLDYVEHQWHREENLYTTDFTNLSQREILERSSRYVGVDSAWYFVDLHNKLDVSATTGSFFRKQFYDELTNQKFLRIESKKAWYEDSINTGVSHKSRKYDYTVDTSNKDNNPYKYIGLDATSSAEFHHIFYYDYKPATIFHSIQGDNRSNSFVAVQKSHKIIMEDLDLLFDLDYDITNL